MTIRHCTIFAALLVTLTAATWSEPKALGRYEFSQPQMGTTCRIVLYAPSETAAQRVSDAAFDRIRHLNTLLSDFQDDSELMRLCKQAGGGPIPVSSELFTVLAEAQDLARRSDGAFDVTIGPLVRLWRRARRQRELPNPDTLDKAKAVVGYENVILDAKQRTVMLRRSGMLLDLGGIAKGYAADEALKVLNARGVLSALVAMGGDIAVGARPPDAEGWSVAIAPYPDGSKDVPPHLVLENVGVSTSGDREQFVEIDGKRYSHVVDPRTGLGLTERRQVTVIASSAMKSDGFDTAISVLGAEKGLALIKSGPRMAVLILQQEPSGQVRRVASPGWPATAKF